MTEWFLGKYLNTILFHLHECDSGRRYAGYECFITPPVCKVKKILNPADPYDIMSIYQESYV